MSEPGTVYFLPLVLACVGLTIAFLIALLYICANRLELKEQRNEKLLKDIQGDEPQQHGSDDGRHMTQIAREAYEHDDDSLVSMLSDASAEREINASAPVLAFKAQPATDLHQEQHQESAEQQQLHQQEVQQQQLQQQQQKQSSQSHLQVPQTQAHTNLQQQVILEEEEEAPTNETANMTPPNAILTTNISVKLLYSEASAILNCRVCSINNLLQRKFGGPAKIRFQMYLIRDQKESKTVKMKSKFVPVNAPIFPPFQFRGMFARKELNLLSITIKLVGMSSSGSKRSKLGTAVVRIGELDFVGDVEKLVTVEVLPSSKKK